MSFPALPSRKTTRRVVHASRRPRRALVLVLVLIVVMMIALAGFSFAELMLTENKAAHLHGDALQMQQALHSGALALELFAELPAQARAAAGGWHDNPGLFRGVPLVSLEGEPKVGAKTLRFSVVAPAETFAEQNLLRFGVEDESARLNLGSVLRWEQHKAGAGRWALLQLPGMTEDVADAILDWIDSDSEQRTLGAENDYYAGLPQPYSARNSLPETLEELLLVKGVTRELLFGADANYNRQIDPDEAEGSAGASSPAMTASMAAPMTPWSWLLTLHSGERNRNSAGQMRINLNDSNFLELHQQLTGAVSGDFAAFVVLYRQHGPAGTAEGTAVSSAPSVNVSLPSKFQISSVLELAGAKVAVPAEKEGEKPKIFSSPLPADPQALAAQLPKLLDLTTVYEQPVLAGRVSVNHAPYEVLLGVPGIDQAIAQRIVAARQNASADETGSRQYATWLLAEGIVDLETMKRLMPFVTAEGDVVRAQIVAHYDTPAPAARVEVVIDAATSPRTVSWRDLRVRGPGFPVSSLLPESSIPAGE